uniref:Uncharacterized protein n=1 Tax=Hyaloperonospora arabidopsidis (strain Emoy2) TaxID=559515 RepID=M4BNP3_HYAAE
MDTSAHTPFVKDQKELTRRYEYKIALKAEEKIRMKVQCKAKADKCMAQLSSRASA